ncbi:YkgJ family cysteine cluster protein [Maridesulfovibrio sp.]|uniref:YkgJ family cysteine cluster protein n=1 Tax=Maridesulfovibrio sp. TaxID=2795000 RepID=UPI002A18D80D|nr:YkgJ family cysteine cluster protein [Maridesulfovibrio sp.]
MQEIIKETVDRTLEHAVELFAEHPEMVKFLLDMSFAVCADLGRLDTRHPLFPQTLAEEGIRLFEANYKAILDQVMALDPEFSIACSAGCSYCCSSHISVMPQEAFNIGLYLARTVSADDFEELANQCSEIASGLADTSVEDFAAGYFRPCPFLRDDKCSIYDVRPIVCRNWISCDLGACRASFDAGNRKSVPQNSLIMVQKDLIFAGAAACLAVSGINGGIGSFIPLMAQVMTDFDGAYGDWISGGRLAGQPGNFGIPAGLSQID